MIEPILDHAVIDVRDRLDDAAALFRCLGFSLSGRGRHTLGSSNHLAIFASNYLELLGWEPGAKMQRPALLRYVTGLNGIVFRAKDTDTVAATLGRLEMPVRTPESFGREVRLPNGARMQARFRTLTFEEGTFGSTRTYFCEHFTPELVWREDWEQHANAARDITRVIVQAKRPQRFRKLFGTMFGEDRLDEVSDDGFTLKAGSAAVEVATPAAVARRFGDAAPDLRKRDEAPVALVIRTANLSKTAAALVEGEIAYREVDERILVPAREAMNVTIEFVP